MKRLGSVFLVTMLLSAPQALAQDQSQTPADMPWFMSETLPQAAHQAAWDEYKAIMLNETAIPSKYKELVALSVAATIPCNRCIVVHKAMAQKAGASEEEIKEALAVASQVRKWSTMLQGSQVDMDRLKQAVGAGQ